MAIPRPPRAVTIDCWSTLLRDLDSEGARLRRGAALAALSGRLGRPLDEHTAVGVIDRSWNVHVEVWRKGGLFGPEGAARWCLDDLELPFEASHVEELADAIAMGTLDQGTAEVDGAGDSIQALKRAGIATALVCDTGFTPARCVRAALERHGLALDHYFFSDEVGVPKPDPAIFRAALGATGAAPAEAVHIGDLRRTDVAGAWAAGMAAIRFAGVHDDNWLPEDCAGDGEADAVLYRWADLPELLGL